MKCDRCKKSEKIFLPYGPHHFCKEHFLKFFKQRFGKTVRRNNLIKRGEKIVVGLSGGKDSTVTLYLLNELYSKKNEIEALMLDEGIKGYREKALRIAKNNCKKWGIPFTVLKFKKEFGISMNEVMKKISKRKELGSSCSFCGPMRRTLLNKGAKKLKADKLATGHNLDDEVQSIVMNFFDNDLKRMDRLGVISKNASLKLVPRIKPLYDAPEKEVIAFAEFNGLKYYGKECCPFSHMAKRNFYRKMLNDVETKFPGTKYSIQKTFLNLKPLIEEKLKQKLSKKCKSCGEPSSSEKCRVCAKLEELKRIK